MFSMDNLFLFSKFSSTSSLFMFTKILVVICLSTLCLSEECKRVNDCICVLNNGSYIDLSSLARSDKKPVWENVKPLLSRDNYTYSYSPCSKFNLGDTGKCRDVVVCQKSQTAPVEYFNIGNQGYPKWNNNNNTLTLLYLSMSARKTIVQLVCAPDNKIPHLEVKGETANETYEMTLTSRCACADLCNEHHLSGGSVLVIIFLIFVSLYLILGIVHSSLTRGAHGWELIPNYEFWMEFPLLVRDGCVFVMSGCKAETAYERI
ncbi:hypothetical protein JTE90_014927 [Oedothorax gibbosus]|uniref:Autophagy-related protein 27 n=1 Tax=Oedothorax gibbosus TaxID=931172 RepID=A0AAV6VL14_9ARAC|nr:hypothetical protein JTE90_014927 [Oedothorax gibbosus]